MGKLKLGEEELLARVRSEFCLLSQKLCYDFSLVLISWLALGKRVPLFSDHPWVIVRELRTGIRKDRLSLIVNIRNTCKLTPLRRPNANPILFPAGSRPPHRFAYLN